jgi:hypothetical protein
MKQVKFCSILQRSRQLENAPGPAWVKDLKKLDSVALWEVASQVPGKNP